MLNRLQCSLLREAQWLVENGVASPRDVDYALSNSIGRRWAVAGIFEIFELPGHPWFVSCQFHPEFQSRPVVAHPLFKDFVGASLVYSGVLSNDSSAEKIKAE